MKKRNPKANCGNCPYSMQAKDLWACGRFPPTASFVGRVDMVTASFPGVIESDLCGEHPDFFLTPPPKTQETPLVQTREALPPQAQDGLTSQMIRLITMNEVAERLGVAVRTVWRGLDCGSYPPPIKLGKSVRMNEALLDEWIADGCPDVRKTSWSSATTPQKNRRGRGR